MFLSDLKKGTQLLCLSVITSDALFLPIMLSKVHRENEIGITRWSVKGNFRSDGKCKAAISTSPPYQASLLAMKLVAQNCLVTQVTADCLAGRHVAATSITLSCHNPRIIELLIL